MDFHAWFLICGFAVFLLSSLFHLFTIIRRANTDDLTAAKGSIPVGIAYSMTLAMSPLKKETAYLHLPTYTAGILYHLGSFLALAWLIPLFFEIPIPSLIHIISSGWLFISGVCGVGILIKRFFNSKLRMLSTPDDYFSNFLVTGFLIISAVTLLNQEFLPILFIYSGILFLYMPVGKLRHIIYFFIARFYLGLFYGKRGVWPPPKRQRS